MTSVVKYYNGERFWCCIGVGFSLGSLVTAVVFLFLFQAKFLDGMAYPFIGVSFFELKICVTTLLKITSGIERANYIILNQPERIRIEEFPRIRKMLQNLIILKILTVFFAIIGLIAFLLDKNNTIVAGVGLGLLIQSLLLYYVDHVAIKGGLHYWNFLQHTYRFHQVNMGFKFPSQTIN